MFHVKQQPVKAAIGQNLDADGATQMRPEAYLLITTLDGLFEFVVNALHDHLFIEVVLKSETFFSEPMLAFWD
jgi:hypothetical protein